MLGLGVEIGSEDNLDRTNGIRIEDKKNMTMSVVDERFAYCLFAVGLAFFAFFILLVICPPLLRHGKKRKAPDAKMKTGDIVAPTLPIIINGN